MNSSIGGNNKGTGKGKGDGKQLPDIRSTRYPSPFYSVSQIPTASQTDQKEK